MPCNAMIAVLRRRRRSEEGVVAILVALCTSILCVVAAMVLDFGLVKVDRQVQKSDADAAVLSGLRAMDFTGSGSAQPVRGVCAALEFLKANDSRFDGLSETSGFKNLATPTPATVSVDCTNAASPAMTNTCSSSQPSSWVQYDADVTAGGANVHVHIQAGYDFSDSAQWPEDSLAASTPAGANRCMDMELTISESRKPGLGSLATRGDLSTAIRTVGRVTPGGGKDAPAMLLLKQSGCSPNALSTTATGSFIHVLGVATAAGIHSPGTIHSDDNGSGCGAGGGNQILAGSHPNSIVAYAAPSCPTCTTPDSTKPGSITSVAGTLSVDPTWIVDSSANVYGTAGTPSVPDRTYAPTGRSLVTRQPVDLRYKSTVQAIISNSLTSFGLTRPAADWQIATCDRNGTVTLPPTVTSASLWIPCTGSNGATGLSSGAAINGWSTVAFAGDLTVNSTGLSITNAATVLVKGSVSTSGPLVLPAATKVYVAGPSGTGDAISTNGSGQFQMHTGGRTGSVSTGPAFPDSKQCLSTPIANTDRALLVVKNGNINTGGLFRACDTTVVMMGGDDLGCVTTYDPTATELGPGPTTTPCPMTDNTGRGTGQVLMQGDTDWTAPSACTLVTSTSCDGVSASPAPWTNTDGPEDLALWSASYATDSGSRPPKARIGGGANVNVRGVFMTPNFDPLVFGGGGILNLTNAQFIASSLSLNGSTQLTMSVDPNSAVPLPQLTLVGLVR